MIFGLSHPRLHLPSLASTPPCHLRKSSIAKWQRAAPPTARITDDVDAIVACPYLVPEVNSMNCC